MTVFHNDIMSESLIVSTKPASTIAGIALLDYHSTMSEELVVPCTVSMTNRTLMITELWSVQNWKIFESVIIIRPEVISHKMITLSLTGWAVLATC